MCIRDRGTSPLGEVSLYKGGGEKGKKSMSEQYDPTPEEIRTMCLEFQAGWSDAERQRRNCYDVQPIEVGNTTHRMDAGESNK